MNKTLSIVLLVAGILVILFFALNSYIYNEKQAGVEPTMQSRHFMDLLVEEGVARVGQPIEGFNAFILLDAFPGLAPSDFQEVPSFEGRYVMQNDELVYIRESGDPVTSAEQTLGPEGYVVLLQNVSQRLTMPTDSEGDVAQIVAELLERSSAE